MITFDRRGNLKPYGPIITDISELEDFFGNIPNSSTRSDNFKKYIRYSDSLKEVVGQDFIKQWINGSFATKKLNPKDIDLVTFIDHDTVKKFGPELSKFQAPNSWKNYGVDAYLIEIYPPQNKHRIYTISDIAYWQEQFTHSRPNRSGVKLNKGFLEIIY